MAIDVLIERGKQKVFASALEWPGWARAAKTSDASVAALEAYMPRYRPVAERAGLGFPKRVTCDVVETVPGSATTDFGAPGAAASADKRRLSKAQAERLAALLEACWTVLDDVAAKSPEELSKGPRGGGRDRTKMLAHVTDSEASYMRSIGLAGVDVSPDDRRGLEARRATIAEAFRSPAARIPRASARPGHTDTPCAALHGTCSTTPGRWRTAGHGQPAVANEPSPPPRMRPNTRGQWLRNDRGCPMSLTGTARLPSSARPG